MQLRGFVTDKTIDLSEFDAKLANDWTPQKKDFEIIK